MILPTKGHDSTKRQRKEVSDLVETQEEEEKRKEINLTKEGKEVLGECKLHPEIEYNPKLIPSIKYIVEHVNDEHHSEEYQANLNSVIFELPESARKRILKKYSTA